jgi:hypothetical protein
MISIILIVCIILLILLFAFVLFVEKSEKENMGEVFKYEDIKNNLKTGDIILFSGQYYSGLCDEIKYLLRTKLPGSIYGHAGMVFKTDKTYLIEVCSTQQPAIEQSIFMNNKKKGGIRLIELDIIIDAYHKECDGLFGVKYIDKEIPTERVIDVLNNKDYRDMVFPERSYLAKLAFLDFVISREIAKIYSGYDQKNMYCTEFLYSLLYHCGAVKLYPSKFFWPHLFTSKKFKDLCIAKFSDPVKFIP